MQALAEKTSSHKLPFITLLLVISFASVNAVLFTPALPNIAHFFQVGEDIAQHTIIWFLVGYALGQLIYGPIANRFGRKPALYTGISIQIFSSLLCILSGTLQSFELLILARFLLAIGSSVGLKITFTMMNECYEPKVASQKISYLLLAFAVTPALSMALGGVLNAHYGWVSCFYAGTLYGIILFALVKRFPETRRELNLQALKPDHILNAYTKQFKNMQIIMGGILMSGATSFVYIFATIAPFIAINVFGMTSAAYGSANLIPAIGLVSGSFISAQLASRYALRSIIIAGILLSGLGAIVMFINMMLHLSALFSLFLPMILIYFGVSFIIGNGSAIAMSHTNDKAHGSASINFLNIGITTIVILLLSFIPLQALLLPGIYIALCIIMLCIAKWLIKEDKI